MFILPFQCAALLTVFKTWELRRSIQRNEKHEDSDDVVPRQFFFIQNKTKTKYLTRDAILPFSSHTSPYNATRNRRSTQHLHRTPSDHIAGHCHGATQNDPLTDPLMDLTRSDVNG